MSFVQFCYVLMDLNSKCLLAQGLTGIIQRLEQLNLERTLVRFYLFAFFFTQISSAITKAYLLRFTQVFPFIVLPC